MKKKIYLIAIFSSILNGCDDIKTDCGFFEKIRKEENCIMIVDIPPTPSSVYFNVEGKNLDKTKECKCEVESRWWAIFSEKIKKGDTIIKRKGELVFEIRKKDTIFKFRWECKDGLYVDVPPEILIRK
ncbi:hypothetical protein [Flavobacterium branchiicola]|uniref:Lipoprotein n=1 Tax=Flavobacterium branchiicola TaxID=1114875 RepID=A0ABV9PCD0_9FLAO|nr:hypothetical protein [Flavobacterium branchiicola]MBS7252449.1 hypothetical protein [Flavobacterium branchiicola]